MFLRVLTPYLVVVLLTSLIWLGSFYLRNHMLAPCANTGQCTTFLDYSTHDPFCIFDPTCVSPLYNPARDSGYAVRWQGIRWVADPLLISGSGLQMLAIPNCIAFFLLATAAILKVTRQTHSRGSRSLSLTAILTWCILEVTGWVVAIAALDPMEQLITPGAIALLLLSVLWFGSIVWIGSSISRHDARL